MRPVLKQIPKKCALSANGFLLSARHFVLSPRHFLLPATVLVLAGLAFAIAGTGAPTGPAGAGGAIASAGELPRPSAAGNSIKGRVPPELKLESVVAVRRLDAKLFQGEASKDTGNYSIGELPPGTYDILIRTSSEIIEGIELGAGGAEGNALPRVDTDEIMERIGSLEPFFEHKKLIRSRGNERRARVLVEQLRDTPAYRDSGEYVTDKVFRRLDLYELRRSGKVWTVITKHHLYREEVPASGPTAQASLKFAPDLSAIQVELK